MEALARIDEKINSTDPSIMVEKVESPQRKSESDSSESSSILHTDFVDAVESTMKEDANNTEEILENGTLVSHDETHDNHSSRNPVEVNEPEDKFFTPSDGLDRSQMKDENIESKASESPVSSNMLEADLNNVQNDTPDSVHSFQLSDSLKEQSKSMTNHFNNDKTELSEIIHSRNGPHLSLSNEVDCLGVPNPNVQNKVEESNHSSPQVNHQSVSISIVDTAAPFESVKEAVTKFGGIVDWKAHKAQTLERHKHVQIELQKVQEEIPKIKDQFQAAEEGKVQVLKELDDTRRLLEELKLNLERAQSEEAHAKQDSELAQLRVQDMEQGIAEDASVAARTQLEVAKARYTTALADLKSTMEELEILRHKYDSIVGEKDIAIKKAEEAVFTSKEMDKTVEDLTLELITVKESLESAHAAHLEAEEHRIGAALAREEDVLSWKKELKQAEEEMNRLSEQILMSKDVKSKLDASSILLLNLKGELAAYMEAKLNQEAISNESAKKEIDEVKASIEKAKEEVNFLKLASESLKLELEKEKVELNSMRQREGMASIAVTSLEAEVIRVLEEIEQAKKKETESREKMVELPKLLQQAAKQADQAKSVKQLAMEEERKAKEDLEQANSSANLIEIRLNATLKEIEAARASEKLALAAIKALEESEHTTSTDLEESPTVVTIPVDEYYNLSKQAHEAEELANERVTSAIAQIEVAKESEKRNIERLEEANKKMAEKKEILKLAMKKSDKAKEGKLGIEQELRKWRAEHEKLRRASNAANDSVPTSFEESIEDKSFSREVPSTASELYMQGSNTEHVHLEKKLRKKKSLFPRLITLLAKKKSQPVK